MALWQRLWVGLFVISLSYGAADAHADKIYLKDGTIQESDQVWLSEAYVHFFLKGTSGVEIRYAKEIVDRVDIKGVETPVTAKTPENKSIESIPDKRPRGTTDNKERGMASVAKVRERAPSKRVDPKIVQEHKGVSFYDPRRKQRYWAASYSKHSSLNQALSALSQMYGRSVSWVESHMGNENDLGAIHHNLIASQAQLAGSPMENKPSPPTPNGANLAKYRSQHTFAASNPKTEEKDSTAAFAHVSKGLAFYDPRRKEKYWTGRDRRYNSLKEAMGALAKQYNVTIEWIEKYMGNTNDLVEIHQNIQNSLK